MTRSLAAAGIRGYARPRPERGAMTEIALYYPYVHPRDEAWVKQALLYWPKIQRIVPDNYEMSDSPLLQLLVEEEILIDRPPGPGATDISEPFVDYVARHKAGLRAAYPVQKALALPPRAGWNDAHLDPRLGWIHRGKVAPRAAQALIRSGLATLHRKDPTWLGVHPALFNVYMCALAGGLSQRTAMMTSPVTDEPLLHVGAFGWSIDNIAEALLTDLPQPRADQPPSTEDPDAQATFIAVAIRTLVPRGLDRVPVERILELRRDHPGEFARYRQRIVGFSAEVAAICGAGDAQTLAAYIDEIYGRRVDADLEQLRQVLEASRIRTVFSALSVDIAVESTIVAAGVGALLTPAIGIGAATAIAVGKVAHEDAAQRSSARAASPSA